jgi:hypothetical protein
MGKLTWHRSRILILFQISFLGGVPRRLDLRLFDRLVELDLKGGIHRLKLLLNITLVCTWSNTRNFFMGVPRAASSAPSTAFRYLSYMVPDVTSDTSYFTPYIFLRYEW